MRMVYGVGYSGVPEGEYNASRDGVKTPAYRCWHHILERCYSTKNSGETRRSYKHLGVVISDDWKSFQVFAEWFYDNWKDGLQIDKDVLGGKMYSEERRSVFGL